MQLKLFSMTTDDGNGLQTTLFLTEKACMKAMWLHVQGYYDMDLPALKKKFKGDVYEAFEPVRCMSGAVDTMTDDEHIIDIPDAAVRKLLEHGFVSHSIKPGDIHIEGKNE